MASSTIFAILNRPKSTLQSSPHSSQSLTTNVLLYRSYYTGRYSKTNLYSRISPLGNPDIRVVPVLDKWVEEGKKVRDFELQRIICSLRTRKRYVHALQFQFSSHK